VETQNAVSRPPRWLLGLAGAAVLVSVGLLVPAWQTGRMTLYIVGYALGCLLPVLPLAGFFQLDKRRAAGGADYRPWASSTTVMRALLVTGFVVGAVHAGLLAHDLAVV